PAPVGGLEPHHDRCLRLVRRCGDPDDRGVDKAGQRLVVAGALQAEPGGPAPRRPGGRAQAAVPGEDDRAWLAALFGQGTPGAAAGGGGAPRGGGAGGGGGAAESRGGARGTPRGTPPPDKARGPPFPPRRGPAAPPSRPGPRGGGEAPATAGCGAGPRRSRRT